VLSLDELVRDESIEACYVATPNRFHFAQCAALLEAGKHVLCEKPATVTPEELEALQTLAERRGVVFLEAIMYLHTPARRAVLEALPSLGTVTSAHLDFSQLSSRWPRLLAGETPNIFNPALRTGAWMDLGIYCLYPALDFFGEPDDVLAAAHFLPTGADGWGTALLRYPDKLVTLTFSKAGQSQGVSQILGDQGTLTIASISQFQGIRRFGHDCSGDAGCFLAETLSKTEVMRCEAKAFCGYITRQPDPLVSYGSASRLALRVSRRMAEVRALAGLPF
jgi:predicted dehydrogenase